MSSPILKIAELLVKQLAKPLSSRVKAFAASNDTFKGICVGFAQGWHNITTRVNVRLMGHTIKDGVKPLDEAKAVNVGADLIGEGFVFGVAASALLVTYTISAKNESEKESRLNSHLDEIESQIRALKNDVVLLMKHQDYHGDVIADREFDLAQKPTDDNQAKWYNLGSWFPTSLPFGFGTDHGTSSPPDSTLPPSPATAPAGIPHPTAPLASGDTMTRPSSAPALSSSSSSSPPPHLSSSPASPPVTVHVSLRPEEKVNGVTDIYGNATKSRSERRTVPRASLAESKIVRHVTETKGNRIIAASLLRDSHATSTASSKLLKSALPRGDV